MRRIVNNLSLRHLARQRASVCVYVGSMGVSMINVSNMPGQQLCIVFYYY